MLSNRDPPGQPALSFIFYKLNAFKEQFDLSEHCVCFFTCEVSGESSNPCPPASPGRCTEQLI